MTTLDLWVEAQVAVTGNLAVHLAEDHAVIGGVYHILQEALLALDGVTDLLRCTQDEGRIRRGIVKVLHQVGGVRLGIGRTKNAGAAILHGEGHGGEDHPNHLVHV